MRMTFVAAFLAGIAASLSGAAASDYAFKLHNRSSGWTITGFYTYQQGRWSNNWLDDVTLSAGESVNMDWNSNSGKCTVPFRVKWADYGSEDFEVDWCAGVRNIYMRDKGFTYD